MACTMPSYAEQLIAASPVQCANRGLVPSAGSMASSGGSRLVPTGLVSSSPAPFDLRDAEAFAASIKERLRTGQLTPEEKARCIEIALALAEPARVAAVHRAVHHSEVHKSVEVFNDGTGDDKELLPPSHLPNSRLRVYRSRVVKHVAKQRSSSLCRAPLSTINELVNVE